MPACRVFVVTLFAATSQLSGAQQVHRCVESGGVRFQDEPCAKPNSTLKAEADERREASKAWDERMQQRRKELDGKPIPKEAYLSAAVSPECSVDSDIGKRYPGPWRDNMHVGISKTLVRNKIRGCGEYKYRASARDSGEYLVHCTADGKVWMAYLTWVPIQKVQGPFTPDCSLK